MALNQVKEAYLRLISQAIEEDIGSGDITSLSVLSDVDKIAARIIFKEKAILCGTGAIVLTYKLICPKVKVKLLARDSEVVVKGQEVALLSGPARAILSGERIVLNFISKLSGIATLTSRYVEAASGKVYIVDTRKTTPGWRVLEKYAVKCGGGMNHRMGLFEQILIKENHIETLRRRLNITKKQATVEAIRRAKEFLKRNKVGAKIEVEVEDLTCLRAAIVQRPNIIMLDNMSDQQIKEAVKIIRSSGINTKIELSGRMDINRIRRLANIGVDFISVGAITHSAPAVDVSMEIS